MSPKALAVSRGAVVGGEATWGYPGPPRALGHSREAHARLMLAHGRQEGIGPTGASVRVGVSCPPPGGTDPARSLLAFQRSGRPSQKALSLPARVGAEAGGSTRLDSQKESGTVGERIPFLSVLESRVSPISWCRQGPPASTRRGTLSVTGWGGKGDIAAQGGGTDGGTG